MTQGEHIPSDAKSGTAVSTSIERQRRDHLGDAGSPPGSFGRVLAGRLAAGHRTPSSTPPPHSLAVKLIERTLSRPPAHDRTRTICHASCAESSTPCRELCSTTGRDGKDPSSVLTLGFARGSRSPQVVSTGFCGESARNVWRAWGYAIWFSTEPRRREESLHENSRSSPPSSTYFPRESPDATLESAVTSDTVQASSTPHRLS